MKTKRNLFRAKVSNSEEFIEGLLILVDSGYTRFFIGDSRRTTAPINGEFDYENKRYMLTKIQVVDEFGNETLYDFDETTLEFLGL